MKMDHFPDPQNVAYCLDELETLWHHEILEHNPYSDEPLDGLILTLLSQNTNDRNRDRAFGLLKARFPSWDEAAKAGQYEIADAIRVGGISNIKAERILRTLRRVKEEFNEYSLRVIKTWDTERIRDLLANIPGVGPKTLACVLLFDLGRPAFPVDTHVARISRRLGWVDYRTTPDEIQKILELVIEKDRYLGGHLNLITHGRQICKARKPACDNCPLLSRCVYFKEG